MSQGLAVSVNTAFGLAFDIEKTNATKSGFKPAQFDMGAGKDLFGEIRLDGFAALLRIGFAERLIIVGGVEGRYKGEFPVIDRAWAIREMLIHDHEIDPARVLNIASNSNTGGNIKAIDAEMAQSGLVPAQSAVVSNLYHIARAGVDLLAAGLPIPMYAAEAFYLLEQEGRKELLIKRLGDGPLAERYAEETQGIADKIRGTYKPRTDAPAVTFWEPARQ